MIDRTVSHYRVLAKIGEGGMGIVYKARDTRLDRFVALKLLRPDRVADSDRQRRFVVEAKSASALNHPNIITIHEIDSVDGQTFIAMEYITGKSLRQVITPAGLPVAVALKYAAQIADALAAVHARGIVHRDLKPSNVMLSDSGRVKVLDFGLAKLVENKPAEDESTQTASESTKDGVIVGTAGYMSPEQIEDKPLDSRSDVFAFGVLLYEMLTGRAPFRGDSRPALMSAILRENPQPLAVVNPAVPREVERVVSQCLEKDPNLRFQSAGDLKIVLEWLARDLEAGKPGAAGAHSGRGNPKRRVAAAALVLAVALPVALAAYWIWGLQPASPPAPIQRLTSDVGLTTSPALSRAGSLLAYASDRGGDNLDIWVRQLAGGPAIRRTDDLTDEYSPRFSPNGESIVFERAGEGVFLMPVFPGEEKLIAHGGHDPRFSPDGQQIAYWLGDVDNPAPSASVFVAPLEGGNPKKVSQEFADARFPVWASDGKHLLFQGTRSVSDEPEWWVVPVDGKGAAGTGVLAWLRKNGLEPLPGPGDWQGDRLVFSAKTDNSSHIWYARIRPRDWRLAGAPRQLTFGSAADGEPSLASDGRVAYVSWHYTNNLWELRLSADGAEPANLHRLSDTAAFETLPSISGDGKTLAFLSRGSGTTQVWVRNLESRVEKELTIGPDEKSTPVISNAGDSVAYAVGRNASPAIYVVAARAGEGGVRKVCDSCGSPADWVRDGSGILYLSGQPRGVFLLDPASGERSPVLRHPAYDLDQPRLSPDGDWVAFVAATGPDRARIYVAPFRGKSEAAAGEWIAVTDGLAWDDKPRWLNAGSLLFYSNRDHFGCLWKIKLDPRTKRAVGPPDAVYHFHRLRLSPRTVYRNAFETAVGRNLLILNLVEISGDVWLTALPAGR